MIRGLFAIHLAFCIALVLPAANAAAQQQQPSKSPATAPAAQPPAKSRALLQAEADKPATPEAQGETEQSPVESWLTNLGEVEARLNAEPSTRAEIDAIREELEALRVQIQAYATKERPLLAELEARLASLGDPPGENAPPEVQTVAAQRLELQNSITTLHGALKSSEEALLRIEGLTRQTSLLRRKLFEKLLFERNPSPLSPELWGYIGQDTTVAWNRLNLLYSHLWDTLVSKGPFIGILLAALALWGVLSFFSRRRIDTLRSWTSDEPPSDWRRMSSAGRVILIRLLPAAIACLFVYVGLDQAGLLSATGARVVLAVINSLIIVVTVQAVIKTALAVKRPLWHLVNLDARPASDLYYHLMALAAIYGIDLFVSEIVQITAMPISVSIAQSVISSALIAGLAISILRIRQPRKTSISGKPRKIGPFYIRLPLWIAAIAIIGAALTGYLSLARFITGQLVVTSTILIVTYLLIIWASAFGQSLSEEQSHLGLWLQEKTGLNPRRREQIALPVTLILKALIVFAAVPFILLQWGFNWFDVGSWLRQAFFGFDVGGIRVSIFSILAAMLLFLLAYTGARIFQSWLDRSVLEKAGVDAGVRDSVRTGIGYLGVTIAVLVSVSYLGLDFSNLAIVAGALSVGIGFGLQSIVNNFVSGLILLAERPIKAGDWIIAGNYEGIVRKISVRSTEIETFDRANVVVPNSILISESVKNWTLHNNTGRLPIPIGVHYNSDPEQVRDILLEVARQNPQVLSNPAPFVSFDDFADNSLNFSLYVYLSNVNFSFSVRTNLRIEILKAFRENNVEIPYPQRDIHISEVKWLKDALQDSPRQPEGQKYEAASETVVKRPVQLPAAASSVRGEMGED